MPLSSHRYFVPALFAALVVLLHLLTNAFAGYGYFRDELYYIVSTDHLSAGYVDHPPLSIWLLAFSRSVLGDSLFAVRLLPAVLSAISMFLTGLLCIRLGGNRYAQSMACLAFLVSPIFLAMFSFYSMNAIDIVLWSAALLVLLEIVHSASEGASPSSAERRWILLGFILGLGMLNKIGMGFLAFGIAAGVVCTPLRVHLRTKGPWVGAVLALAVFAPYIVWNARNDWAHLEFIRNASAMKYAGLSRLDFLAGQLVIHNPVTAPLWLAGLLLFMTNAIRVWRAPGIVFLGAALVLVANGTSKPEYLAPAFPLLLAAGGVRLQTLSSRIGLIAAQRVYPVVIGLGLMLAPATLPLLSVDAYLRFADTFGIKPSTAESKELAELPQFYADMFGWPELAERVSEVYHALPDSERGSVAIFGRNYGEASAVTFFGKHLGLPPAISGHNSFYLWGPGETAAAVVIVIGGDAEDHRRSFTSVERAATHRVRYAMPYENNLTIFVCRGLKRDLREVWKTTKNFS